MFLVSLLFVFLICGTAKLFTQFATFMGYLEVDALFKANLR